MKFLAIFLLSSVLLPAFSAHAEGEAVTVTMAAGGINEDWQALEAYDAAYNRHDEAGARAALNKIFERDANDVVALGLFGQLEYKLGHYEAARGYLERALAGLPSYTQPLRGDTGKNELLLALGKTYEVLSLNDKAVETYRQLRPASGFHRSGYPVERQAAERILALTGACQIDEVEQLRCQTPSVVGAGQEPSRAPSSDVSGVVPAEK